MRAVQVTRFGGPEVLVCADVEKPAPISTEVLVRVVAAGINPVDGKTRRGEGVARWVGPTPFILGWDVCGVVEAMGYGVTRFKQGDIVYGMPRFPRAAGAYAEYVAAPSRQFARIPDGIFPDRGGGPSTRCADGMAVPRRHGASPRRPDRAGARRRRRRGPPGGADRERARSARSHHRSRRP